MQIKSGSYAGTGIAQSITGVGFQPVAVFIKGSGATISVVCMASMGADQTKPITGSSALFAGGVTSLDADGFTVGTDSRVNAAATTNYWIAFGDNGVPDLHQSSYVGDGGNDRSITGSGFQPDQVFTGSATTAGGLIWRASSMGADASQGFAQALTADQIQAMEADGFQVGTSSNANANLVTYHYLCLKDVANLVKTLSYTGNGADGRSLADMTFQPDNVITKSATNTNGGRIRFKDQVGDLTFPFSGAAAAANNIQALEADGFQVGTAANVNENTIVFHTLRLKDGTSSAAASGLLLPRVKTQAVHRAAYW